MTAPLEALLRPVADILNRRHSLIRDAAEFVHVGHTVADDSARFGANAVAMDGKCNRVLTETAMSEQVGDFRHGHRQRELDDECVAA